MNELIEQLAKQAFGTTIDTDPILVYEVGKFARLIVQECAGVCEGLQNALDKHKLPTPGDCAIIIKEHFGVKE
jgi:hypothetical protein